MLEGEIMLKGFISLLRHVTCQPGTVCTIGQAKDIHCVLVTGAPDMKKDSLRVFPPWCLHANQSGFAYVVGEGH